MGISRISRWINNLFYLIGLSPCYILSEKELQKRRKEIIRSITGRYFTTEVNIDYLRKKNAEHDFCKGLPKNKE